jgi:hypothetical protein
MPRPAISPRSPAGRGLPLHPGTTAPNPRCQRPSPTASGWYQRGANHKARPVIHPGAPGRGLAPSHTELGKNKSPPGEGGQKPERASMRNARAQLRGNRTEAGWSTLRKR